MHNVIKGCVEVLDQGKNFLNSVSDDAYTKVVKPFFISSSGEHMRHILDHFLVLIKGYENGMINYDNRNRGSQVESQRLLALTQLNEIVVWLMSLEQKDLDEKRIISTEVALSTTIVTEAESTLQRELVFAASHAVHHYASIATSIQMQDLSLDKNFGIAPATASYLRSSDKSCVHSAG